MTVKAAYYLLVFYPDSVVHAQCRASRQITTTGERGAAPMITHDRGFSRGSLGVAEYNTVAMGWRIVPAVGG